METLSVIVAAAASYAAGAAWYMALAKPWMAAAGIEVGEDGKPANRGSPMPYVVAFIAALAVAGMMRHIFSLSGIDTPAKGLVSGLGIGLFLAAPWIVTNHAFGDKPRALTLIDGGYTVLGCTVIGLVLTLL